VKAAFSKHDVDVDTAANGETGHWMSFTKSYDLILLDLKMPGISGVETLRRIKKDRPEARVVICTAYADSNSINDAMQYSPFGVVEKTADIDKLVEVFRHYNLLRSGKGG